MSHKHKKYTDEELRQLAVDVYDCKAFTSLQCRGDEITQCFPILMFLMSPPTPPSVQKKSESSNIKTQRRNKLNNIDDVIQYEKDMEHYNNVIYPEWEKNEKPLLEEYVNNIGMVYEYYGKEAPLAVNGKPMFFSAHVLTKEDTNRFLEIYSRYELKRQELDQTNF